VAYFYENIDMYESVTKFNRELNNTALSLSVLMVVDCILVVVMG
jgi:hypothetical protein